MQVLGLIVWMFQYMDAENESFTDGGVYKLQQNKNKKKTMIYYTNQVGYVRIGILESHNDYIKINQDLVQRGANVNVSLLSSHLPG